MPNGEDSRITQCMIVVVPWIILRTNALLCNVCDHLSLIESIFFFFLKQLNHVS